MNTPTPNGYHYRNAAWPYVRRRSRPGRAASSEGRRRFRWFGLEWRIQPLYEQAGCPFGAHDRGLLLWVEFGRGSCSN